MSSVLMPKDPLVWMWPVFNMQHIYKLLAELVSHALFLGGLLHAAIASGPSTSSQSDSSPWKPSSSLLLLRVILIVLPVVHLGGCILSFLGVGPERSMKESSTTNHRLVLDVLDKYNAQLIPTYILLTLSLSLLQLTLPNLDIWTPTTCYIS